MKVRRPADSNSVRNTNARKHEGMEMRQGCFPQKGSPLGLAVCHCGQYQTVHCAILEAFAMVTPNTKMWNLQDRLQCYGMLTRLHGGSDGRSCLRCSLHFHQKCPAAVLLITSITQEFKHNATRTIRYTDRQTDLAHLVAAAFRLSAWQCVSHSLTCLRHKSHFHLNGQFQAPSASTMSIKTLTNLCF